MSKVYDREYLAYLERLFVRKHAARRKKARAHGGEPCMLCGDPRTEYTMEGDWLCRPHRQEKESLQPKLNIFQKLEKLGVEIPSEAAFLAGEVKEKHKPLAKVKYPLRGTIKEFHIGYQPRAKSSKPRAKAAPKKLRG